MRLGGHGWTIIAAALSLSLATASAQELRIGLAAPPTSADPQFTNSAPNIALGRHIFDGLMNFGPELQLLPGLAETWHQLDSVTWELGLRRGVRFHDGSPFTADDVICSWDRAVKMPGSQSTFATFLKEKTFQKVDDFTVRVTTRTPSPLILDDLAMLVVVSRRAGCPAATAEFNAGSAAIGTGAYRLVQYLPGEKIVLARNDDYWAGKPTWNSVVLRPIADANARMAALRAGDVDLIDAVPANLAATIGGNSTFALAQGATTRVVFIMLDQGRDRSPFVLAGNGAELASNPLKDPRVRRALSKAIDRNLIRDKVMLGAAIPAGQLQPEGIFGFSSSLAVEPFDPEGAKRMLAEAGWPDGFRLTIHGPNDRYQNDSAIVQAVAQMWSSVGVRTAVDVMPFAKYSVEYPKPSFSASLLGVASTGSGGLILLRAMIAGFDPARGWGTFNAGRYANKNVDDLIDKALQTLDPAQREALTIRATEIAIADTAIIPLHFQVATWAYKSKVEGRELSVVPQLSEFTLAMAASLR